MDFLETAEKIGEKEINGLRESFDGKSRIIFDKLDGYKKRIMAAVHLLPLDTLKILLITEKNGYVVGVHDINNALMLLSHTNDPKYRQLELFRRTL